MKSEKMPHSTEYDRYILLQRYGGDHWTAMGAYKTMAEAEEAVANYSKDVTCWRIVKVYGLPAKVPEGEV